MPHFSRLVVALAVLGTAAFGQLPDEDTVIKDIRSELNKKKTWAKIELYNKWALEHDKVLRTSPPDMAKHPFRCETAKDSEGVHSEYKGLAIYIRSGPDSWIFNRLFFFEDATKMVGAKAPSAEEMFKIAYEGLRTNARSRAWGSLRSDNVTHVDSIEIPEDPEFKQVSSNKLEFYARVTFDQAEKRGRSHRITKKTALFRVTAMKKDGAWVMGRSRRKGEFQELGFEELPEQSWKRTKTLAEVDLDQIYGDSKLEAAKVVLPEAGVLRDAVVAYYNNGAREFDKLFGSRKSEEVTEVESVSPAPFREGANIDPDSFVLQVELIFRSVTGYRNNMKWLRVRRVAQCTFEKTPAGYVVKNGRPVANTEKTLETISADNAVASGKTRAKAIFAGGGKMSPTGGSNDTAAAASTPGSTSSTPAPAAASAEPSQDEVVKAFRLTVDHSAGNFSGLLGADMAKKVVDIEAVRPDMKTMNRVDRQSVQLTVSIDFTWKRFDNVLMRSRRQYDIKVKDNGKGGRYVSGARARGREQELAKVDSNRAAVKAMPLYVDKGAKLVNKKKPAAPPRRKPAKKPAVNPKKIARGLLGGG